MSDVFADVKSSDMAVRRNAEDELVKLIAADSSIIKTVLEEIRTGDVTSRWYLARALTKSGQGVIPILISSRTVLIIDESAAISFTSSSSAFLLTAISEDFTSANTSLISYLLWVPV